MVTVCVVTGHDMKSLLFNMLDEFLYNFSAGGFICKYAKIMDFDRINYSILVVGYV